MNFGKSVSKFDVFRIEKNKGYQVEAQKKIKVYYKRAGSCIMQI
jgi:hypothetical protein